MQAALRRLVDDELTQHTENQEACTVSFDVESFCDSISPSLVARAGLKLAYPVVPWPRDGPRLEDEREDVRGSVDGPLSKLPRGSGGRGLGSRKLMVPRRWVRRLYGSGKRGQERLMPLNAEDEAGV